MENQTNILKNYPHTGPSKITAGFLAEFLGFLAQIFAQVFVQKFVPDEAAELVERSPAQVHGASRM